MKHFVAPSLLSADFGNLKPEMDMINRCLLYTSPSPRD